MRLIDGDEVSTLRGRVEVRILGTDDEFGTVCGENWSQEDASVVCKMIDRRYFRFNNFLRVLSTMHIAH